MSKKGSGKVEKHDSEPKPLIYKENVIPEHTRGQGTTVPPHGHDHEYRDIDFKSILRFAGIVGVVIAASMLAMWWMFNILMNRTAKTGEQPSPMAQYTEPPAPRLQAAPPLDQREWDTLQAQHVRSYAWVDQGRGIARIPVSRAIDIIAAKGLPWRGEGMSTVDTVALRRPATTADTTR